MPHQYYLLVLLWCYSLSLLTGIATSDDAGKTLEERKQQWRTFAQQHHDPSRLQRLKEKIQKVKGIYVHPIDPESNVVPRYGLGSNFHTDYVEKMKPFNHFNTTIQTWKKQQSSSSSSSSQEWNPYYFYFTDQQRIRIEKTVVVLVWESLLVHESHAKYRQYFHNMVCYLKHYQLKALVYIITRNETQYEVDKQMIHSLYSHVEIMDYPYELFWQLISEKETNVTIAPGRGDYEGTIPSFRSFGALPMLIPQLELLRLGVNTIYFDTDIGFLEDPIPYLTRGDADIVVSPETKNCKFPNYIFDAPWSKLEPNTGAMFVQSRPVTINYFYHWLKRNIQDNCMNDQRVLWLGKTEETIWTKSCDDMFDFEILLRREQPKPTNDSIDTIKYCYLNEFRFFNGFMEWYCGRGRRGISKGTFDLVMEQMSNAFGDEQVPVTQPWEAFPSLLKHFHRFPQIFANQSSSNTDSSNTKYGNSFFYHPTTLHMNYCNNKQQCFEETGLWLLSHSKDESINTQPHATCTRFDIRKTSYAKVDWLAKRMNGMKDVDVITKNLKDGDVVQIPPMHSIFLFKDGYYQYIPDIATFEALGFQDFKVVKKLNHPVYQLIPFGKMVNLTNHVEEREILSSCSQSKYQLHDGIRSHLDHLLTSLRSTHVTINLRGLKPSLSKGQTEKTISLWEVLEASRFSSTSSSNPSSSHDQLQILSSILSSLPIYDTLETLQKRATTFADGLHNPQRTTTIQSILQQSADNLQQHHRQHFPNLPSKTVIISILEIRHPMTSIDRSNYEELLQNYLCNIRRYNLSLVLFIAEQNKTKFEEISNMILKQFSTTTNNNDATTTSNNNIWIVDYPYSLLWRIIAKKSKLSTCGDCLHFHTLFPTFKTFGFIMMLTPIWEVLQLGYNVIYLDMDMTFLHNPLQTFFPSLSSSAASSSPTTLTGSRDDQNVEVTDFMFSVELRTCHFTSILHPLFPSRPMEPNTGVMFLRYSRSILNMFQQWMLRIVQQGEHNDQKALSLSELGGRQVFDCNAVMRSNNLTVKDTSKKDSSFTYCYLNDMMVQNGKISQQCPENKAGSRAEYIISLMGTYIMLYLYPDHYRFMQHIKYDWSSLNSKQQIVDEITYVAWKKFRGSVDELLLHTNRDRVGELQSPLPTFSFLMAVLDIVSELNWFDILPISPTILHANYCDYKKECLMAKGLWQTISSSSTYDDKQISKIKLKDAAKKDYHECGICQNVDYHSTWFGQLSWLKEYQQAKQEILSIQMMSINDTFRVGRTKDIYLVTKDGYRPFVSGEQFLQHGHTWDQVKHLKNEYFFAFNQSFINSVT